MVFVRWINERPYVYDSYMGVRIKKGTKERIGKMQKEMYLGTYDAVRKRHPCGSMSQLLTERQVVNMSTKHATYLTKIDAEYKPDCMKRMAKKNAKK